MPLRTGQALVSGLVLKLRAHEEVLVNGVMMRNGERNIRLLVKSPDAHILRMREALRPEEATCPVGRLCYMAQQVVAGERAAAETAPDLANGIDNLRSKTADLDTGALLDTALTGLREKKFYLTFRALKRLMPETSSGA
ncbi:MAG: flagellar biosynthesis repressor FlbT [Pseudomonadota bacterium]